VTSLIATVPFGLLADRFGTRRFLILTRFGAALGALCYLLVQSAPALAVAASLFAISGAGSSSTQALAGELFEPEERMRVVAAMRAIGNVGYGLGASLGAVALTVGTRGAYDAVVVGNAVSYLASGLLLGRIRTPGAPRPRERAAGPAIAVFRDRRFLLLTLLASVPGLAQTILDLGVPLWIVHRTDAPHAMAAVVVLVNTVIVVLFQVRVARDVATVATAARAIRTGSMWFAACAVVFAGAASFGAYLAVVALALGAILLTLGEMLDSTGWWVVSFELAPAERRNEYLAAFSLTRPLAEIAGPLVVAVIVSVGDPAWIVFAGCFLLAGSLAKLVLDRPPGLAREVLR
jgi:MFS family permease